MASLAAEPTTFGMRNVPPAVPMRANAADQYYRGGLVFNNAGYIEPLVAGDASEFVGVCAETRAATAQGDYILVYPAVNGGQFHFANANFTIANQGLLFHQPAAGEDDPSTLITTAAGASGAVGRLVQVVATGVDGWIDIGDRSAPVNA